MHEKHFVYKGVVSQKKNANGFVPANHHPDSDMYLKQKSFFCSVQEEQRHHVTAGQTEPDPHEAQPNVMASQA